MERYIVRKGVLSAALVAIASFACGFVAIAGFVLGDFQAVSYSAVLETCGLSIICTMTDVIHQQIEDIRD